MQRRNSNWIEATGELAGPGQLKRKKRDELGAHSLSTGMWLWPR
jgi:hypothetical protein